MIWSWNGPKLTQPMLQAAAELGVVVKEEGTPIFATEKDKFCIFMSARGIEIEYSRQVQLCRAFGILAQEFSPTGNQLKAPIEQTPLFSQLGIMFDASRGAVPTVETLEVYLRKMAVMGYSRFMLYTEDTYPIPEQPWFGYLRGGYTKPQLQHIDAYAQQLGIEVIPCVQTLAHLDRFLHWPAVKETYLDTADVLLADTPETEQLVEQMFASLSTCFSSRKIHIGMDEAIGLGMGRHVARFGYENPVEIMLRHLKLVCRIAEKYGFAPMMWSDMFFRLLSSTGDYYNVTEIPAEIRAALPSNLQLIYWDYYHQDAAFYSSRMAIHKELDQNTAFAGGAWNWLSPVTDYALSRATSMPALKACADTGVQDVWLTLWGDDGGEASIWSTLLVMQMYAEFCYTGKDDEDAMFARFENLCKAPARAFAQQSLFNRPACMQLPACDANAAKFLLYQDVLLGLLDEDIRGMSLQQEYAALAQQYNQYAQQAAEPFASLFAFWANLAAFLQDKAEIGLDTRAAYTQQDTQTLKTLAQTTLPRANAQLTLVRSQWQKIWMDTNHPIGFEVHDIRLGGVAARLDTAAHRILQYLDGSIDSIPELEAERQRFLSLHKPFRGCYFWVDAATASKL